MAARAQPNTLDGLGELVQGLALRSSNSSNVVQVRHLEDFWVGAEDGAQIPLFLARGLERHRLREGDVVLTLRNQPLRASVVPQHLEGRVAGQNLAVFRGTSEALDPLYLVAFLRSQAGQHRLAPLYQNSTSIRLLTLKQLGALEIPLPPLDRQQQLAALMLAAHQEKRAALEQIEAREDYANAVFARALGD